MELPGGCNFFTLSNGLKLAYQKTEGGSPAIIFLHGFRSGMMSSKGQALANYCQAHRIGFLRFDFSGHGASEGKFEEATIGQWRNDLQEVIDKLTEGPQILIGSSMGAWLAILAALDRPERISGLMGIASAPDFTERLIIPRLSLEQKKDLSTQGFFLKPSMYETPYIITEKLLSEARNHLVLDSPIPIKVPLHVVHGMKDADVPWSFSVTLAEKVLSHDVQVSLLKNADHRLATPQDIEFLTISLKQLWTKIIERESN